MTQRSDSGAAVDIRRRWLEHQDTGEAAVVRSSCRHIQYHPGAGHGQGFAPAATYARRVQSSGDTAMFRHGRTAALLRRRWRRPRCSGGPMKTQQRERVVPRHRGHPDLHRRRPRWYLSSTRRSRRRSTFRQRGRQGLARGQRNVHGMTAIRALWHTHLAPAHDRATQNAPAATHGSPAKSLAATEQRARGPTSTRHLRTK